MQTVIERILPDRAEREVRLRDFVAPIALGILVVGALAAGLQIFDPHAVQSALRSVVQFGFGLLAWFWLRPVFSAVFYSIRRGRLDLGYARWISPAFFASYGAAVGAIAAANLPHAVIAFDRTRHLAPVAGQLLAIGAGIALALLVRHALLALPEPLSAPLTTDRDLGTVPAAFSLTLATAPSSDSARVLGAPDDEYYTPLRVPDFKI